MTSLPICPICDFQLEREGATFALVDIFERWNDMHSFSTPVKKEHLSQSATTVLYGCPNCLIEIFLPQIIGTKEFYQELQEDNHFSYYREDKWDFDQALKDISGCKSIIEIGCGPGSFLARAKPHLQRACGIEYNKAALESARRKGLDVYGMDYDTKLLEASFDAVFSFHVLEHVADPVDFINGLASLINKNGKICISVPNQDGPLRNIDDSVMNMPPHHATRWRLKTFEVLAKRMNLQISKVAYEPLLIENYGYYSYYWVQKVIPDTTIVHRKIKKILSILMEKFFKILIKLGMKYFTPLHGQAIYVVMKKN